ncbi:MAG: ATP-binding protein [Pseudomonadota bacterium]
MAHIRFPARTETRIALSAGAIAALIALACTALTLIRTNDLARQFALTRLNAEAERQLVELERLVSRVETDMISVRPIAAAKVERENAEGILQNQRRSEIQEVFSTILASRDSYSQLTLVRIRGRAQEMVRVDRTSEGPLVRDGRADLDTRRAARLRQAARQANGSLIWIRRDTGGDGPAVDMPVELVAPLTNIRGEATHALVLGVDLFELIAPLQRDPTYKIIVSPPGATSAAGGSAGRAPLLNAAKAGVLSGLSELLEVHVEIVAPEEQARTGVLSSLSGVFGFLIPLPLLAALAGGAAAHLLLRPLREFARAARAHNSQTEAFPADVGGPTDIQDLAHAFRSLSEEVQWRVEQTRAIVDGAGFGVLTIDNEQRILTADHTVCRIFGYAQTELEGSWLTRLIPHDQRQEHTTLVARALAFGPSNPDGMRYIQGLRRDGSFVPLDVSVTKLGRGDTTRIIGLVRDISDLTETQVRQAELITALERSNTELDRFAYAASHDLKAPLRVIANAALWLQEDLGPDLDADSRENLDLMRQRIQRMERLLDDLLAYSKVGRADVSQDIVNGDTLLADTLELLEVPDGFRVVRSGAFARLSIARMPLQTVLLNLLSNAIKHHDRSVGWISVDVEILDESYLLSVADDGPGIPKDYHERVFQIFETLRPRDQVEGSGMGLALVKKTVELVGGAIEIVSGADTRGTTVRVLWPKDPHSERRAA